MLKNLFKKNHTKNSNHYLVVLLGNVGDKYAKTRHNAAWIACESCFPDENWKHHKYSNSEIQETTINEAKVTFVKPHTLMNNSGQALQYFVRKEKISPQNIIIIHDDIEIPFATIKISFGRGGGHHNGISSIERSLKTPRFIRLRIGIGRTEGIPLAKFVLSNFSEDQYSKITNLCDQIKQIIQSIVANGIQNTMGQYNKKTN